MRIAFVGLPLAALLLARDGHEIAWAGVCRAGAIGTRRLRRVASHVEILPDLAARAEAVAALGIDLVVSWFWTRRIPPTFRQIGRMGAFGVHPSLLPRWRGPDPFYWALRAGDTTTGVTAHLIDDEYDTGALLDREALDIDPSWNAWDLARALDRPSLRVLRRVARAYADGAPPTPVPQAGEGVMPAPAPDDDALEITWGSASEAIVRLVRAAAPFPGAFTELHGETIVVTEVRATNDYPRVLEPGQAWVRKDGIAVVRTGDGAIELLGGRLDDADEPLDAGDLAACVSGH